MSSRKNQTYILFLSAFSFIIFSNFSFLENDIWQLAKDKNGIKIYIRNEECSAIKSIKATMTFNASLSALTAIVMDVENYPQWVYHCKETKLIKNIEGKELVYYHVTQAPWPISYRDNVSRFIVSQNKTDYSISIKSSVVNGVLPEKSDYIRVKKSNASWNFKRINKNTIAAEYILSFDPGGNVPAWLINLFITEGPYETFIKMKLLVDEEKYKNASLPFIDEVK
jgi:ribosome-associated toxin RatA of RatAB toxin-antitoxin module